MSLPAAVFVVQHVSAESSGLLSHILTDRGTLPAVTAEDGMPIERGRVYVAPPDRHLFLTGAGRPSTPSSVRPPCTIGAVSWA